jgi:hypothetical protein
MEFDHNGRTASQVHRISGIVLSRMRNANHLLSRSYVLNCQSLLHEMIPFLSRPHLMVGGHDVGGNKHPSISSKCEPSPQNIDCAFQSQPQWIPWASLNSESSLLQQFNSLSGFPFRGLSSAVLSPSQLFIATAPGKDRRPVYPALVKNWLKIPHPEFPHASACGVPDLRGI